MPETPDKNCGRREVYRPIRRIPSVKLAAALSNYSAARASHVPRPHAARSGSVASCRRRLRCAGRARHAGSGCPATQPRRPPVGGCVCLRHAVTQPADAVCSTGGAQPHPPTSFRPSAPVALRLGHARRPGGRSTQRLILHWRSSATSTKAGTRANPRQSPCVSGRPPREH